MSALWNLKCFSHFLISVILCSVTLTNNILSHLSKVGICYICQRWATKVQWEVIQQDNIRGCHLLWMFMIYIDSICKLILNSSMSKILENDLQIFKITLIQLDASLSCCKAITLIKLRSAKGVHAHIPTLTDRRHTSFVKSAWKYIVASYRS